MMAEPLQDVTLTAEVRIESETLWCSGQVINNRLNKTKRIHQYHDLTQP